VRQSPYLEVDKQGATVDFVLTARRDTAVAKRIFDEAIGSLKIPEKINRNKIKSFHTAQRTLLRIE
jgi:transposase-like protein